MGKVKQQAFIFTIAGVHSSLKRMVIKSKNSECRAILTGVRVTKSIKVCEVVSGKCKLKVQVTV